MQRGFTNIRPVRILTSTGDSGPMEARQILIFNNSAGSLWLGDDENSATGDNGVPVLAGTILSFLWLGDLWVGADLDSTEFRYLVSPHLVNQSGYAIHTWEELGRSTPPPPKYYNRPAGR